MSDKDPRGPENLLLVGRMGRPFGVRGYGRVVIFSENPARFGGDHGKPFWVAPATPGSGRRRRLILEDTEPKGESLLLKWRGVDSPETLREISGWNIFWEGVDDWCPEDPENIRISELIGMTVRDCESHRKIGTVVDFYERPGQDLLAIDAEGKEVLCPFVEPLVPLVDRENGEVHVRWSIVGT